MIDTALNARLAAVRRALNEAREAAQVRREVTLVAVSKRHSSESIRAAYACGQRDFGESYAQELRDKAAQLADLPDLRWHYVGALQRNDILDVLPYDRLDVGGISHVRICHYSGRIRVH